MQSGFVVQIHIRGAVGILRRQPLRTLEDGAATGERVPGQDRWTALGISLIFGGALGNVYDRIIAGRVTDFLDFYAGTWHWYTFNIADSAICAGAAILALTSFFVKPQQEAKAA